MIALIQSSYANQLYFLTPLDKQNQPKSQNVKLIKKTINDINRV